MKLTKYPHAGLVFQKKDTVLIVDPGEFCDGIETIRNVEALVVTHIHGDHYDPKKVDTILRQNPECRLYTTQEVANTLKNNKKVVVVSDGDAFKTDHFEIDFYGKEHAVIHEQAPHFSNIGVYVEGIYYPGDSYTLPNKPVVLLGVPISGPWLKVSEAIDFMLKIAPQKAFGTHDALLSTVGLEFTHGWLSRFATEYGIDYSVLKTGDTIEA